MIDLHIHLLPGIDDGAEDIDEAVEMCRLAAADGCEALVATPHQRHERWWNTDPEVLERLRREIERRVGPRPRLLLGGEVRIDSGFLDDLDAMPESGLMPLAGSRYLLLEFDRGGVGPEPESLVHEVTVAGWRPIVAHPEFAPALAGDVGRTARLVDQGALLQVTAMSVTEDFGAKASRYVKSLFDSDLVHVVASDAHGVRRRPPGLARARAAISRAWGEAVADRVTRDNPRAVLEDRPIAAASPVA